MDRRTTVDDLLASARTNLVRVTPEQAFDAQKGGAVLVDVRSQDERERQGFIPGAVHHPLSVVLWRLDPAQPTSNPKPPLEANLLLICREGYSSSLAAAQLREIGFAHATDVIGGVDAWLEAGLPVELAEPAAIDWSP
jgi:rhodanese-related sulfurtransferase